MIKSQRRWSRADRSASRNEVKVLLSAFACRPGHGSEPHVGWRTLLAAAAHHDVWLLTNDDAIPGIRRRLDDLGVTRVQVESVGAGFDDTVAQPGGSLGYHYRYDRWQRRAGFTALDLDGRVGFDLVHHATLAAYWARAGVAALDRPFVWGPVGGGVNAPASLLPALGARGMVNDVLRFSARRSLERLPPSRQAVRRAAVALAQNPDTGRRLRGAHEMRVLSNAWSVGDLEGALTAATRNRSRNVVFAGRLIPWKGARLAVRAFARVRTPGASLDIFGAGQDGGGILRLAERLGVRERVNVHGGVERAAFLAQLAVAGALLHTALHEESGLSVAEALRLGTPVACIAHGGPQVLVGACSRSAAEVIAVPPRGVERTTEGLARALERCLEARPPVPSVPLPAPLDYEGALMDAYDWAVRTAGAGRPSPRRRSMAFDRFGAHGDRDASTTAQARTSVEVPRVSPGG